MGTGLRRAVEPYSLLVRVGVWERESDSRGGERLVVVEYGAEEEASFSVEVGEGN